MSKIKFYGYKKCDTCRKAEADLIKKKKEFEFIDITLNPPTENELKQYVKKSKLELKKFFNTSGVQYKELNMKDKVKTLSDDQIIKLLSNNGRLIKRPIIVDGESVTVGLSK